MGLVRVVMCGGLALALMVAGCSTNESSSAGPDGGALPDAGANVVGVNVSFSGEHARKGQDVRRGIEIAVEEMHSKQILHSSLRFHYLDTRSVLGEARNSAVNAIDRALAVAIIGDVDDLGLTRGVMAVANGADAGADTIAVAVVSPALSVNGEPKPPPGLFLVMPSWEAEVEMTAGHIVDDLKAKSVSVLWENEDQSTADPANGANYRGVRLAELWAPKDADAGAPPASVSWSKGLGTNSSDDAIRAVLEDLRASQPKVVYAPMTAALAMRVLRLLPDELRKVMWVGSVDWYDIQLGPESQDGSAPSLPTQLDVAIPNVDLASVRCGEEWTRDALKESKNLRDRYLYRYGEEPRLEYFIGGVAANILNDFVSKLPAPTSDGSNLNARRTELRKKLADSWGPTSTPMTQHRWTFSQLRTTRGLGTSTPSTAEQNRLVICPKNGEAKR